MSEEPAEGEVLPTTSVADTVPEDQKTLLQIAKTMFDTGAEMPERARQIIAMRAFGESVDSIAKTMGCGKANIYQILERWDRAGIAKSGDIIRKAVLCGMMQAVAFEALGSLKRKEIQELPADKRVDVAIKAARAAEEISVQGRQTGRDAGELVNKLRELNRKALEK